MVPDIEEVYQTLLNSGMTDAEIEHQVDQKSEVLGGFLSSDAILFILAKERGLRIPSISYFDQETNISEEDMNYDDSIIDISEIKEEMSKIVSIGRIERIFPIREFLRKDGTSGNVGSFIINDGTGRMKIISL